VLRVIKKANDHFETTRPTRMRPETSTSWDRGQDQLLWAQDRDQKSGLETFTFLAFCIFVYFTGTCSMVDM